MLSHTDALIRIAVGTVLGAAIGYERNRHRRPVGLRTHLLVALASSLFMVVSIEFVHYQQFDPGKHMEVDVSRIAASVVSAVGFLGGGAILRTGFTVQGVTTAAALWLVTAIGLSAGAGMFVEAGFAWALGLLALSLLRRLEDKKQKVHGTIAMHAGDLSQVSALVQTLKQKDGVVTLLELRRSSRKEPRAALEFDLMCRDRSALDGLMHELERQPGVQRVTLQQRT